VRAVKKLLTKFRARVFIVLPGGTRLPGAGPLGPGPKIKKRAARPAARLPGRRSGASEKGEKKMLKFEETVLRDSSVAARAVLALSAVEENFSEVNITPELVELLKEDCESPGVYSSASAQKILASGQDGVDFLTACCRFWGLGSVCIWVDCLSGAEAGRLFNLFMVAGWKFDIASSYDGTVWLFLE